MKDSRDLIKRLKGWGDEWAERKKKCPQWYGKACKTTVEQMNEEIEKWEKGL